MGQIHAHDVSNFRKDLTKYINQVKGAGDTIVVKKYDKPFAVLVPFNKIDTPREKIFERPAGIVRSEIGEILNQVYYNKSQFVITFHNLPIVTLRPLEEGEES